MTPTPGALAKASQPVSSTTKEAREVCAWNAANELVFAVVGHIGSGNTEVAKALLSVLTKQKFDVHVLKARKVIADWARSTGEPVPEDHDITGVADVERLQDLGDEMRKKDHAAVARRLIDGIRTTRTEKNRGPGGGWDPR